MGIKLSDKDFEIMCKIMIKEYKQKEYHSSIRVRIHGVLKAAFVAIDKKWTWENMIFYPSTGRVHGSCLKL